MPKICWYALYERRGPIISVAKTRWECRQDAIGQVKDFQDPMEAPYLKANDIEPPDWAEEYLIIRACTIAMATAFRENSEHKCDYQINPRGFVDRKTSPLINALLPSPSL
jgi:hypothetical protein